MEPRNDDSDPLDLFDRLEGRPTPELDGDRLWAGISRAMQGGGDTREDEASGAAETDRPAIPAPWFRRIPRWAAAAALVAAVGLGVWAVRSADVGAPMTAERAVGSAGAVGAEADAGEDAVVADAPHRGPWRLDVRLVQGYRGSPPDGALDGDALEGAGGASALRDVRASLADLLEHDAYALLGRWNGELDPGAEGVELAVDADHRLTFDVDRTASGNLRLTGLRFRGRGGEMLISEMVLVPGRLYVVGVPSDDAGDDPSLVIALRAAAGREDR